MKQAITAVKTKSCEVKSKYILESTDAIVDDLSRGSIIMMGAVSAFVGVWAVACFAGALMMSNSTPMVMVSSWVRTIVGM